MYVWAILVNSSFWVFFSEVAVIEDRGSRPISIICCGPFWVFFSEVAVIERQKPDVLALGEMYTRSFRIFYSEVAVIERLGHSHYR